MVEIVSTPGVVGGKHRVKDRRISVVDIVVKYQELDWKIEKIAREFDLTPVQVAGALKFYFENPRLIRKELREERREVPA